MQVKSIKLRDFRNYKCAEIEFQPGKNIIIGDNAQGKTNLLEAVDLLATGRSSRASDDKELVGWGARQASVEVVFQRANYDESLLVGWSLKEPSAPGVGGRCQKTIKVNGVSQQSVKGLLGRLVTVSFSADDLKILRGGPRYRREWLDSIAVRLRPAFHDVLQAYSRSLSQRNRLLKTLAEKGKLTVSDQDELLIWDKQLAKFGTQIIKMRLKILADLLPAAEAHQSALSGASEKLSIDYAFRAQSEGVSSYAQDEEGGEEAGDGSGTGDSTDASKGPIKSMNELAAMENLELATLLLKLMKERRWLELRRRQSLTGPHRDNLIFNLNGASAVSFASQGQQRSLVLALKLSELAQVHENTGEAPVLLLDDVLSELDEKRADLLLSVVGHDMQTIMSTTHLTAINETWLGGARVLTVRSGELAAPACSQTFH
jgi:DNA replication and repair protein RecF